MPSNLPINDKSANPTPGRLYVVGTPIGNLGDITLRALEILKTVDLIAAEDTRHTARLLSHYGIKTPLISYHDFNERERSKQLLVRLSAGETIALVSNAGSPLVSDPGYSLIAAAIGADIPVVPIPGPSAVITAICAAGLPTDTFVFAGFPHRKKAQRSAELNALRHEVRTIVFYESPRRLLAFIAELQAVFGDRNAVLARELTKIHEEFVRGCLSQLLANLKDRESIKGECTLLVAGYKDESGAVSPALQEELQKRIKSGQSRLVDIVKEVSSAYGVSKKDVYNEALRIKTILR